MGNPCGTDRSRVAASSVLNGLRYANPGLGSKEEGDVAPDFELFSVLDRGQAQGVFLAVVRVKNLAAFPNTLALGFFGATDDFHPELGLALAIVGAQVAVGLGARLERLFN